MSIYNHACHPENRQFYPDGSTVPECNVTQAPVDGCYAPNLRCGDDPGFEYSNGNSVGPRPVHWFDRSASFSGPLAPQFDRGGFLSGARRKWGENTPLSNQVQGLGLENGVDENVDP